MAKRKHMLWFVGLAFAFLLGWHFLWSDRTPDGQTPLTYLRLNNTDQFKHEFDGKKAKTNSTVSSGFR
jgi:hypothetical protein